MDALIKIALLIHIAAGFTALLMGLIAILSTKGGKKHIFSGRFYFWAMTIVASTAIFIAFFKELDFLFSIAIFSFYLTYTGYMSVKNKLGRPDILYKIIIFLTVLVSMYMILTFNTILVIFGVISIINIYSDIWFFRSTNHSEKAWLYRHIAKMDGAYIATVTAFLVTNFKFIPSPFLWLIPTLIGSILISYAIRKYKMKFVSHI